MSNNVKKEALDTMFSHMHNLARYWATQNISEEEKIDGMAFTVMNILDNTSGDLPSRVKLVITDENGNDIVLNDDIRLHSEYFDRKPNREN